MMKVYREEMILRTCNCDFEGQWRPSAILEAMQEAAGTHSELLGCGRGALLRRGIVWVLSRSEVHMDAYPGIGEKVIIETFPMLNRRSFFPRYFRFLNGRGDVLGRAATLWVLLDVNTRRMLPPGELGVDMPDNTDLTAPMGMPATVCQVPGEENLFTRLPQYTDLDVNGHVNNTRYADWLCDALGIQMMARYRLASMLVNYDAEVRPGQEMSLRLSVRDLQYRIAGYHEDKLHFEIGGCLAPRDR